MVAPLFDFFDMVGIYYTNIEFADWLEKGSYNYIFTILILE